MTLKIDKSVGNMHFDSSKFADNYTAMTPKDMIF